MVSIRYVKNTKLFSQKLKYVEKAGSLIKILNCVIGIIYIFFVKPAIKTGLVHLKRLESIPDTLKKRRHSVAKILKENGKNWFKSSVDGIFRVNKTIFFELIWNFNFQNFFRKTQLSKLRNRPGRTPTLFYWSKLKMEIMS